MRKPRKGDEICTTGLISISHSECSQSNREKPTQYNDIYCHTAINQINNSICDSINHLRGEEGHLVVETRVQLTI